MSSFRFALLIFFSIGSALILRPGEACIRPSSGRSFLVLLAAPWFLLPMFANALYWRHIRGLIDGMPRAFAQDPDKKLARLERDGGTGMGVMIAVCAGMGFFFIFVIGVLAAIAIPAYQDYTIRAQVTEGLNLAAPVEGAIAEFYAAKRAAGPRRRTCRGAGAIGQIRRLGDRRERQRRHHLRQRCEHQTSSGKRLILLPGTDAQGDIVWRCGNDSASARRHADADGSVRQRSGRQIPADSRAGQIRDRAVSALKPAARPHLERLCEWTNSPAGSSRPWPMRSPWPSAATTSSSSPRTCCGALLDQQDGSTRPLLVKAGANVNKLRKDLDAALDQLPKVEGTPGDVHVSHDLNRLLNVTDKLAQQRKDDYISSELFVLAAFEDKHTLGQDSQGRRRVARPPSKRRSSRCAAAKP